MSETPRQTAIRYLEWCIATKGMQENPSESDYYNLRRFVEILKELE